MLRNAKILALLTFSAFALGACASSLIRTPVPKAYVDSAQISGLPQVRVWGDAKPENFKDIVELKLTQMRTHNPRMFKKGAKPKISYLAISGGAEDGAFGAGFLNGWSKTGKRPQFDIVTGVSTGALIAPFAFLGPAYDPVLKEIYTKYGGDDLITKTPILSLVNNAAISDNAKLAGLIDKYVDQAFLTAIAAEYNKGRRLLVGTTNLDAQRPVIWDMGKIAASNTPGALKLFRRVLLASISIPSVFPPVMVSVEADGQAFEEMHVDGGTTSEVFFLPTQIMFGDFAKKSGVRPQRSLYIIWNGRLSPEWKPVKAGPLAVGKRSISTLIKHQGIGDLSRIYVSATRNKIAYHLASIPDHFARRPSEPFDLSYMQALFEEGYKEGAGGKSWAKAPPGL